MYFQLESQLFRCTHAFKEALLMTAIRERHRRRHCLEGALSDAWQSYCGFVRQLCIRSCTGCTTATGVSHLPSISPASWQRASYIAIEAARGHVIKPTQINCVLRREPTWGDSAKIVDIVSALNPGNAATLKGYLAGGLRGPKHCQIVRNACAHRNHQSRAEVELLAPAYVASRVRHPTDAMCWREPSTYDFAFLAWVEDMRTIAEGAVQ